jgi:CheY-like chemotaxis protein
MTLPFAEDPTTGEVAPAARAPIVRPDARRVLVVDDNHDAADLLAEGLSADGHSPVVAYDGPAALAVAAVFKPHLAFLDIGLPAMDGYELAQRLKQLPGLSGIHLIAVTGYGQASDRMRSKVAGFDEHLVKPIDVQRAAELIVSLTAKG